MLLYPAIDLLDGQCVRLKKGDFNARTDYSSDPVAVARGFKEAGARCLHVVDLSGAKDPARRQTPLITALVASTSLKIQVGGGIREAAQADELLAAGADRVVIGSAAVSNPKLVLELAARHGAGRVTVALDVNLDDSGEARVAVHGWTKGSGVTIKEALAPLASITGLRVLCTDIARDGMMAGPNVELYRRLMKEFGTIELQASGGVRSLEDLLALKAAGLASTIVGKALYEGAVDLKEALAQC